MQTIIKSENFFLLTIGKFFNQTRNFHFSFSLLKLPTSLHKSSIDLSFPRCPRKSRNPRQPLPVDPPFRLR